MSGHPHLTVSSVELPSAGDEEEVVKHLFLEPRSPGNPGLPCPAGARWRRLARLQLSRGGKLVLPLLTQCSRLASGSRARHLQAENLTSLLWLHGQNPLGFAEGGLPLPFPSLPLPSSSHVPNRRGMPRSAGAISVRGRDELKCLEGEVGSR